MADAITSGAVTTTVKKIIDKIFSGLDKCLEGMDGWAEKKEEKDIEEDGIRGKYFLYEVGDNGTLEVEVFGVEDHPGKFIVRCKHDDKDVEESNILTEDTIVKWLTEYADKHDLGTVNPEGVDEADLAAASKIAVTLKKVTANKQTSVELVAINASKCVEGAMDILAEVLEDDEFVKSLTNKPTSYEITSEPDALTVQEISNDSVDSNQAYIEILKAASEAQRNLDYLSHNMRGSTDILLVKNILESIWWTISSCISTSEDWCIQTLGYSPNTLTFTPEYVAVIDCDTSFDEQLKITVDVIERLISSLELYYVNVDAEKQSTISSWLEGLKKVARQDLKLLNPPANY